MRMKQHIRFGPNVFKKMLESDCNIVVEVSNTYLIPYLKSTRKFS